MSSTSQGHKIQVHGASSEGIRAPIASVAIADATLTVDALMTPIAGAAAFANAAAVNTHNTDNIVYTMEAIAGVSLNAATGALTGTPTALGTYKRVLVAKAYNFAVKSNVFTITVEAA